MRRPARVKLALIAMAALGIAVPLQGSASAQAPSDDSANSADRRFVSEAIAGGNQEILQARSELKSTSNASVRLFAQTMIRDHTAANAQIAAVARRLGVAVLNWPLLQMALPGAMPAASYMRNEVADHQKTIALFKAEESSGSHQLAATAGQILPVLDSHLAMAQQFVGTGSITPRATPAPPAGPGK